MKRCRNSKGRFTRCRKGVRGVGKTRRRRSSSKSSSSCRFGRVKSGARKGMCRKRRVTRRKRR